ncbi:glycoside hydrolase domain-containing protein [Corynebacterium sp.]|uniref:glycoside hydrolase domain-containing protein n=1 Tax=Corynebacterium sp. TaxID=1720 RepID=UPI0026DCEBB5|nr:glycoside hydrolase domain-containing protein [Corynebacterium sp.]MDO4610948.1 DUF1906 domain-containing protein [Corynebacterium sp.]
MVTVLDYAGGPPAAAAIRAAGHGGAVRYIADDRTGGSMPGKPLKAAEVEAFKAAGLDLAVVWQYGKDKDSDIRRGSAGGAADALEANRRLAGLGLVDWPVYFAVDFDITLDEWNDFGVAYFRSACDVLGRARVGIYGHSRVIAWAVEDGVVADLGGGKALGWQTKAWSQGERAPEAVLYQGTFNVPVGGVMCDVNDVWHPYWGQHPPRPSGPVATDPPPAAPVKKPTEQYKCDADLLTWRDNGISRAKRLGLVVHTDESAYDYRAGRPRASAWTADQLAEYNRRRDVAGGSYHIGIDRAGRAVRQNDDQYSTWSVGSKGNDTMWHICLTGTAYQTREQWLAQTRQLDRLVEVLTHYCLLYGIPARRMTAADIRAGRGGIGGHWDCSKAYGGSDHWDPGGYDGSTGVPRTAGGFPWDVVIGQVAERVAAASAPVKPAPSPVPKKPEPKPEKPESGAGEPVLTADTATLMVLDQLAGLRDKDGRQRFRGWAQLGGRTLVDAVAAIGAALKLDGFADPKGR